MSELPEYIPSRYLSKLKKITNVLSKHIILNKKPYSLLLHYSLNLQTCNKILNYSGTNTWNYCLAANADQSLPPGAISLSGRVDCRSFGS